MFRGNYAFGPIAHVMQRRAKKESDYMNYVYDDLIHNYIDKKLYPGISGMRPKIVPIRYLQNKSYQGGYDPDTHVITTPVFRGSNTRIMYPFDMARKSLISHETTRHLLEMLKAY